MGREVRKRGDYKRRCVVWVSREGLRCKNANKEMENNQYNKRKSVVEVLQKTLKFSLGEIDYLFAFPGKTTLEVMFKNRGWYDKCLRTVEKEKLVNPELEKFLVFPMFCFFSVFFFSPIFQDISTWLLQHCDVKSSMQMTDDDGIKNRLYRFDVVLRKDNGTKEVRHLPRVIQIGTVRGHVFYLGQPQVCRRCGHEGHKAVECEIIRCRNCKEEGHSTRECRKPIKCSLCREETHVFRDCPVSYANLAKSNMRNEEKVIALLDEESEEEREKEETESESLQGGEMRKEDGGAKIVRNSNGGRKQFNGGG
uniref:CCHC-type domain-containing protein n=1 Tax=Erpetoichthys calabaricus TaxID=27687 RepID=A0A8C4TJK9_ERPCA